MNNLSSINNWDLVDLSCPKIVGPYILTPKSPIDVLSKSKNIWERRISIISTFYCIKLNNFEPTLRISLVLLKDPHDLIHKAVGWMLREVGKKDKKVMMGFMREHAGEMHNVTFRYACERLNEKEKRELKRIKEKEVESE